LDVLLPLGRGRALAGWGLAGSLGCTFRVIYRAVVRSGFGRRRVPHRARHLAAPAGLLGPLCVVVAHLPVFGGVTVVEIVPAHRYPAFCSRCLPIKTVQAIA